MAVSILSGSACGDPLIILDIPVLPNGTSRLEATVTPVTAQPNVAQKKSFAISIFAQRYAIDLMTPFDGLLQINLTAYDSNDCIIGSGMFSQKIPSGLRNWVELPVPLMNFASPSCILHVNPGGSSGGSVRSTPAGIDHCSNSASSPGTCFGYFSIGTQIDLTATLPQGGSVTWSSNCAMTGVASCEIMIFSESISQSGVAATFQ